MSVVIKVENLSKQYRLGLIGTNTLRGDLQRWWHRVRGMQDPTLVVGQENVLQTSTSDEYIWALKDINFDVQQGEVLGIIGKNGAGKSTLLKLLSRVTAPTTGSIKIKGRIASLLEVGTGFHPELTGKENIFLNGAILGMTKTEIKSKLDEIIDFAGVARYADTPVKRYSSGMYVRLAFAVAAHLEPEILVIDEVLAVGDAEFQKKAIGKMKDVSSRDGRTVLFVSHNMAAVKSLCSIGMLLENGRSVYNGNIDQCVSKYLKGKNDFTNHKIWQKGAEIKNDDFELLEIGIKAKNKDFCDLIKVDESVEFFVLYRQKNPNKRIDITLHIKDDQGNALFSTGTGTIVDSFDLSIGLYRAQFSFDPHFFNWGNFYIDLYVVENRFRASIIVNDILSFSISNKEQELGTWMGREPGGITPQLSWEKIRLETNK